MLLLPVFFLREGTVSTDLDNSPKDPQRDPVHEFSVNCLSRLKNMDIVKTFMKKIAPIPRQEKREKPWLA